MLPHVTEVLIRNIHDQILSCESVFLLSAISKPIPGQISQHDTEML